MTEQANRIDWLERQLAQVKSFVDRDIQLLNDNPGDFSIELSLSSWKSHQEELQQELRQAKSALVREVVELRLLGRRMDGSIPLKLLTKLADKFNNAISHAAYHLRHGRDPSRGIPDELSDEIDLRLSGLAFGSTRLVFAGNIYPDTTGDSAMESALEQIFDVLDAPSPEKIRELVTVIGVPATRALSEMLGALEKQDIAAELTWPAPNAKLYKWGGTIQDVRCAHQRLSTVEKLKPEPVTLRGIITQLRDNGAIYIKSHDGGKIKVSYNRQQYVYAQQYTLGMNVEFKAMRYVTRDPVTNKDVSTYKLVIE
ncbi:hypothetical protein [Ectopseudomonas hydrolytica]|uniref:hypothetical protein n=1 Tax=Ectopseudomonas hydrolytica TaxID=2493633 RepID=UPI00376F2145